MSLASLGFYGRGSLKGRVYLFYDVCQLRTYLVLGKRLKEARKFERFLLWLNRHPLFMLNADDICGVLRGPEPGVEFHLEVRRGCAFDEPISPIEIGPTAALALCLPTSRLGFSYSISSFQSYLALLYHGALGLEPDVATSVKLVNDALACLLGFSRVQLRMSEMPRARIGEMTTSVLVRPDADEVALAIRASVPCLLSSRAGLRELEDLMGRIRDFPGSFLGRLKLGEDLEGGQLRDRLSSKLEEFRSYVEEDEPDVVIFEASEQTSLLDLAILAGGCPKDADIYVLVTQLSMLPMMAASYAYYEATGQFKRASFSLPGEGFEIRRGDGSKVRLKFVLTSGTDPWVHRAIVRHIAKRGGRILYLANGSTVEVLSALSALGPKARFSAWLKWR